MLRIELVIAVELRSVHHVGLPRIRRQMGRKLRGRSPVRPAPNIPWIVRGIGRPGPLSLDRFRCTERIAEPISNLAKALCDQSSARGNIKRRAAEGHSVK